MYKSCDFKRPSYCFQQVVQCDICTHATWENDCHGNPIEDNFKSREFEKVNSLENSQAEYTLLQKEVI